VTVMCVSSRTARKEEGNLPNAMTTTATPMAIPTMAPVDTSKTPELPPSAPAAAPFVLSRAPVFSVSVMVGKLDGLEPVGVRSCMVGVAARAVWEKERRANMVAARREFAMVVKIVVRIVRMITVGLQKGLVEKTLSCKENV
jgi:hypothetical protein